MIYIYIIINLTTSYKFKKRLTTSPFYFLNSCVIIKHTNYLLQGVVIRWKFSCSFVQLIAFAASATFFYNSVTKTRENASEREKYAHDCANNKSANA